MPSTVSSSDPSPPPLANDASNLKVDDTRDNDIDYVQQEQKRKRAYLSLLPPDQIIELCLSFERHVPIPIRTGIWPTDLEAEILKLQYNAKRISVEPAPPPGASSLVPVDQPTSLALPATPSQQVHPPGPSSIEFPIQPLDSSFPISSPDEHVDPTGTECAVKEPQRALDHSNALSENVSPVKHSAGEDDPSKGTTASNGQATSNPPVEHIPERDTTTASSPKANLTPFASASVPPQPTVMTPTPYSYAPYGYSLPPGYPPPPGTAQAAYPHTPYYPPPGNIAGYPAYPGYPPYPPPPGYPPHQPPPPPASGEDLPSYEDMIVEALMDLGEPEGAAPKDLFLWMGARWPLQTNFRPSASQALQKAYRRGRLEKRSGGRYRLNPTWEGGATSKRTTRRPQTLAQTTYAMHQSASSQTPPSSSPFTNAPLPQRTHISPPPHHTAQQQPYGAYAYPYSAYAGYSGYTAFSARPPAKATPVVSAPSTSAKTIAPPTKTATKTVISAVTGKDKDSLVAEEGSDAWVAAQHILKAINFGSLQDNSASAVGTVSTLSPSQPMAGSSHIVQPPVMASLGIDVHATSEDDGLGRATLTDEERASLQAQLALLAAQLSEIAAEEDIEEEHAIREDEEIARQAQQPHAASPSIIIAPEEKQGPNPNIVLDVNQFPDSAEPLAKSPTSDPPSVQDGNTGSLPILTTGSLQYPRGSEELTGPSTAPSHSAPVPDIAEESDDDEDMEMVDVDSYMLSSKGIQT